MPDPFIYLPAPLPLLIMEAIEDLPTLHYILQASSISASIFARFYSVIISAIVAHYPPTLQNMLRLSLYLQDNGNIEMERHTKSLGALHQLLDTFLSDKISDVAHLTLKSPPSLAAATSHARTAQNVQQLAHQIFEAHLARTREIIPSYQLDRKYQYCLQDRLPECQPYEPLTWSTPSWIEEQRILRALWRIQVHTQLRAISTHRQTHDLGNDVDIALETQGPESICRKAYQWELDELNWLYDYLLRETSIDTATVTWGYFRLSVMPQAEQQKVAMPALYPKHDGNLYHWNQAELHLDRQNAAAVFMRVLRTRSISPLRGDDMDRFWQLGLGIWDGKRMAMLGLLRVPSNIEKKGMSKSDEDGLKRAVNTGKLSMDELFTRWRSVWLQAPAILGYAHSDSGVSGLL